MFLDVISVNLDKPELNHPFLIFETSGLKGVDSDKHGSEFNGFTIILPCDSRFMEIDEEVSWYTATVAAEKHILVRVPAWPFAFWPWHKGGRYRGHNLYDSIIGQLDENTVKNVNHIYTAFDAGQEAVESAETMSRKWKYYMLDFSHVKDVGVLSSKVIYDEAGKKELLDFDIISAPMHISNESPPRAYSEEFFVGFKVARLEGDGEEGKKTKRSQPKKSKFAAKMAAKGSTG